MDDHAQGGSEPEKPAAESRAPYVRPALKVYGDIAKLTQTIGHKGTVADGGANPKSKTS